MDPILNPYAPGAGAPPPELSGRDQLLHNAAIALERVAAGRFGKSLILTGLRGVGKTVLLNRMRLDALATNKVAIRIEAQEGRSLPSLLASGLKGVIYKLSKGQAAAGFAARGLKALAMFVGAMKLKYHDIEVSLDVDYKNGDIIPTDFDESLIELFSSIGTLAKERKTAIVLFIDELQVVAEKELASLIMALHMAAQDLLPITMIAAGLPQLPAIMGETKTYAERLFEFPVIGKLDRDAAIQALTVPAEKLDVHFTPEALEKILKQTQGYAYFLQEWGKHAWDVASASPITAEDAQKATALALNDLDASFFRVRFDQLTAAEKEYLYAMATLGRKPVSSGDIAKAVGKKVTALGAVRKRLINKGIIYSPAHGETAFTVPLFNEFMQRIMS